MIADLEIRALKIKQARLKERLAASGRRNNSIILQGRQTLKAKKA